ncbi:MULTISPECIES: hypothetical protein [unclassified Pseudomonas]|uniref:hypothetical protein n=1 Tax=unclassified Pseudomonas TaxID=196821 RepID=UPI001032FBA4|nr:MULTISPECIES: hypothetical protein [unclassified Pseudomonas]
MAINHSVARSYNERPDYWQQWFSTLAKDPNGLAVWRVIFEDVDVCEYKVEPNESQRHARRRHQRKLKAMQIALAELQAPEFESVMKNIRHHLWQ